MRVPSRIFAAGLEFTCDFWKQSLHDLNATFDTMLRSGAVLARLVLPEMVQRKEGQVVFMNSARQRTAAPSLSSRRRC